MVEFAIVSIVFLLLSIGTLDLGRAIYLNAQLEAGVRDAAREGKRMAVSSSNGFGYDEDKIEHRVTHDFNFNTNKESPRPGLSNATVTIDCASGCPYGSRLTVSATLPFTAVAQEFLGIGPITLGASASVEVE
jgi:Flp pilus assembly protein TadG